MGLSFSVLLIALGAILYWAVAGSIVGIGVNTLGVILIVAGVIGLVLSLVYWSSWGGFRGRRTATYVDDAAPVAPPRRRATVVAEEDVRPGPPPP